MARVKIKNEPALKNWEDVDITLKEIAEHEIALEKITSDMNLSIHNTKLEADDEAKPHQDRIALLSLQVKDFVEENRVELDGKTKQLTFGKTGFRLSTRLVLKNIAQVIENLKKFNMKDCITIKEAVNKDVLKAKYSEEDIIKVGGSLKKEDSFWYETERDSLQVKS